MREDGLSVFKTISRLPDAIMQKTAGLLSFKDDAAIRMSEPDYVSLKDIHEPFSDPEFF
ncbi:hypothetical protein KP509_23G079400 [Ceratopteris richardii]|nr:hypothetical protein KP509_23G079400 [Ceratopteris richardii]